MGLPPYDIFYTLPTPWQVLQAIWRKNKSFTCNLYQWSSPPPCFFNGGRLNPFSLQCVHVFCCTVGLNVISNTGRTNCPCSRALRASNQKVSRTNFYTNHFYKFKVISGLEPAAGLGDIGFNHIQQIHIQIHVLCTSTQTYFLDMFFVF